MKFYDRQGNEIKPIDATSSCDWCGYGIPPEYSVGPKGVFDGDLDKVWNAGETAPNCSWFVPHMRNDGIYGVGCVPSTIRQAWIRVDFGKNVELSKIRINTMGDSANRVDELTGSVDGQNYFPVCKISASPQNPARDGYWIECSI